MYSTKTVADTGAGMYLYRYECDSSKKIMDSRPVSYVNLRYRYYNITFIYRYRCSITVSADTGAGMYRHHYDCDSSKKLCVHFWYRYYNITNIYRYRHSHLTGPNTYFNFNPKIFIISNSNFNLYTGMSLENNALEDYVDSEPETEATIQLPKEKVDQMLEEEEDDTMDTDPDPPPATSSAAASAPQENPAGVPDPVVPKPVPPPVVPKPVPPPAPPLPSAAASMQPPLQTSAAATMQTPTTAPAANVSTECDIRARALSSSSKASGTSTIKKDQSGAFPRAYFNIRAARNSLRTVRTTVGCTPKFYDSISSFESNDAKYPAQANYRHNYTSKQNISASFSLDDFTCNTCWGGGATVSSTGRGRGLSPVI
jgi:hypothetical protein